MIIPIRCFTCGKPIGQYWEPYRDRVAKGEDPKKVLDSLGIERYCCRAVFVTNKDLIKTIGQFCK